MAHTRGLQELFRRYRRPGDFVIALLSFLFALFLAVNLPEETAWVKRTRLFAQPAFWPAVSIAAMVLFSGLHLAGALWSERLPGRWQEVWQWVRALEFVAWFMAYVALVPIIGYLPATLLFTATLTRRLGYRGLRWQLAALLLGSVVVVLFRGLLSVRIPAGAVYDWLPPGSLRTLVMTWL